MDLTDEQWELVRPSIPEPETMQPGRKGGRPYRDPRDVLNAALWILRTWAPWADSPGRYPPYQTCHRRIQQLVKAGVPEKLLRALAEDLRSRGKLDLTEAYVDGSHAGAKRGGPLVGITCRGKATKIMAKAYDSEPLDAELAELGVEMIPPPHPKRRRKTQDLRKLRRYRHRWRIERLFAWLLRQRRLVSRWEWKAENALGLLQLACAQILWRRFRDAF